MVHSDDDDFAELINENTQLKEALNAVKKRNEAYDGEVRTLQRKLIKLLEEKVERLETELKHFVRIDNVEEM